MKILHALFVFCGLLIVVSSKPAAALDPALLGGVVRPVVDWDFRSMLALPPAISFSRTTSGATIGATYDWGCSPVGQLRAFASDVPMLPVCDPVTGANYGWGIWPASGTEQLTWGRDLTQATWSKTNATVALDQAGVDGSANAASSILATAAGGKVVGSGNAGAAVQNRVMSAYVKRLIGSGDVWMSGDSGTNWVKITNSLSTAYQRMPQQGLYALNVNGAQKLGFKLDTSGDKIAVDLVQFENDQNSTFYPPSPPIAVSGTANLTRVADSATATISNIPGMNPDSWTIVATVVLPLGPYRGFNYAASASRRTILQIDDGNNNGNNAFNLNFQNDAINNNPSCAQGQGVTPSCPDVNLDSRVGAVQQTKVRCSTVGNTTYVTPYPKTFFIVAVGYDIKSGVSILCDNGYGVSTVNEVTAAPPGFVAGQLTRLLFNGASAGFANGLGAYLARLTILPRRVTGTALAQAMMRHRQAMPSITQSYLTYNDGTSLPYNDGTPILCYRC